MLAADAPARKGAVGGRGAGRSPRRRTVAAARWRSGSFRAGVAVGAVCVCTRDDVYVGIAIVCGGNGDEEWGLVDTMTVLLLRLDVRRLFINAGNGDLLSPAGKSWS